MPDLPILNKAGQLHVFAPLMVAAITTYPEDNEKQTELVASRYIGILLKMPESQKLIREAVKHFPWMVPALHRAPTPDGVLEAAARDHALSWAAGEILLTLLIATIHHPELRISVTKAVDGLSRFYPGMPTYGGGTAKAAKRTLWAAWRRFRSVAHFHAVQQIWIHDNHPSPEDFGKWCIDNFEEYIAVAEVIRKEVVLRRLVPEDITWRVPAGFEIRRFDLQLGELKPEFLKVLRAYRPEHSNRS